MALDEFIKKLSEHIPIDGDNTPYYDIIVKEFDLYLRWLNTYLPDEEFKSFLQTTNELKGTLSKKRFINLIAKIQKKCIEILQVCYKGDLWNAANMLVQLMTMGKCTQYKLKDIYANYFRLDIARLGREYYYRRVDYGEKEEVTNCWHLPYNLRHLAAKGRFNMIGYPCFYLSDSFNGAYNEVGALKDGKLAYVGKFLPEKNVLLLNLTLPLIDKMSSFDKFCFMITYPIYLLCFVKARCKDKNFAFCEEYVFPQLFFHVMFYHTADKFPNFDGISYNSLEESKAINIVLPAKYEGDIPPSYGFSSFITSLFKQINIEKIEK